MSNIKRLKDKDGNDIFPVTHVNAVFDGNKSLREILNNINISDNSNNIINVKNPGNDLVALTGDNTQTDVGPYIQAMIDALPLVASDPLTRNGVIYFPPGKYYIKTPIIVPLGVSLIGSSYSSGYANPSRGFGSLLILNDITSETTGPVITFKGSNLKGFGGCLRDLTFSGNAAGMLCVLLDNVFCFEITGCVFEHLNVKRAIQTSNCNRISVRDSDFVFVGDGGKNGSFTTGDAIYFGSAGDSDVFNCFIESCGGNAITLGTDCKVSQCFLDLNKNGVSISGKHNKISDCSIKLNYYAGVFLGNNSDYTEISGCSILSNNRRNSGITNSSSANIVIDGNKWFSISDCQFDGTTSLIDINIKTSSTGYISNCRGRSGDIFILDTGNAMMKNVHYYKYNIVCITQSEYDQLETKDPNTIYFIKE